MRIHPIAFVLALFASPIVAHADDSCAGWFCDEPSKLNGEPVSVELLDGSVLRGVIVELAADHVTIAVGDAKVTVSWAQIAAFKIEPAVTKTVPADPKPEVVIVEKPAPAKLPEPPTSHLPPREFDDAPPPPPPPPPQHDGPFTLGARLKLLAAFGGTAFHQNSHPVSDYAPAGIGFELSFAIRLNSILRSSYEHAELAHGERNPGLVSPTSDAVGIGLRALFGDSPDVCGVLEVGAGYRWLNVPYANGRAPDSIARKPGAGWATYEGTESLRVALGTAANVDRHGRFELLLEGALGRFSHVKDDNLAKGHHTLNESSRSHHMFIGVSFGVELGP